MTSASQADRKPNSFDGKHSFARAEQHSFVSIVTFLYYYRIVMTSNSSKKLHLWHKSLVSNKCRVVMIAQHSVHPKTTEVGRGRGGNVCCVMFWWGQKEARSGWGQKCLMFWWGQKKGGGGGGRSVCCVMIWWDQGAGYIWRRLIWSVLVLYPNSKQPEGRDTQPWEDVPGNKPWRWTVEDPRVDCGFQPQHGINKVQEEGREWKTSLGPVFPFKTLKQVTGANVGELKCLRGGGRRRVKPDNNS